MNPIVTIALAIPFVGLLTRHLLVTRARYREALQAAEPGPAGVGLAVNGVALIVVAAVIGVAFVRGIADWPAMVVVIVLLGEGIWDLWHGMRLKGMGRDDGEGIREANDVEER